MEVVLHAINWFEIPVIDFERARKFYSDIFDYTMPDSMVGRKRMGFFLYQYQLEGIGGAIVESAGFNPSKDGAKVYLNGGEDLQIVLDRVASAGGTVITSKTFVNEQVGYFASFSDTEGNEVYLHSRK